jgi:hypothetical protein
MTSSTSMNGMSVYEEIDAHIQFLQDPHNNWVQQAPESLNEGCMIVRSRAANITGRILFTFLSEEAQDVIEAVLREQQGLYTCTVWNDKVATSKAQVIEVLEKARAKA